jgi:hypothetical protein
MNSGQLMRVSPIPGGYLETNVIAFLNQHQVTMESERVEWAGAAGKLQSDTAFELYLFIRNTNFAELISLRFNRDRT